VAQAILVLLAGLVAAQYFLLAVTVLKFKDALTERREYMAGMVGAVLFFMGCAYTHIEIALHADLLFKTETAHGWHHTIAHVPQAIGGWVALFIAARYLDVRVRSKREAEQDDRARQHDMEVAQMRRMDSLGRLAGGIIHDFNHIIAASRGFTEFIQRDLEQAKDHPRYAALKESADAVQTAISQGEALAMQLRDFSRKHSAEAKPTNVNQIVKEAATLLRFPTIEVDVVCNLDDDAHVLLVHGQLRSILLNLAFNARDAMPDGGVLRIRTFQIDGSAALRVTDTGTGMSHEALEHLFEPYFTTKTKGQGTGLGLATVYGQVKTAGGEVRVNSDEGEGTDIVITLPLVGP
jgi:two-component system, cell cycle sensor histidine kinase and response regulator CckA